MDDKPPRSKGQRHDWEAIQRDYRTGQFTLRELESKHGAAYADICRRAKREGWTQDLSEAVRQATTAALIQQVTTARTTEAQQSTIFVVTSAAEANKNIILGHRTRLVQLSGDADLLRAKLTTALELASEPREIVAVSGGFEALGRMTKMVIEKEREAFGIDSKAPDGEKQKAPAGTVYDLSREELMMIARGKPA